MTDWDAKKLRIKALHVEVAFLGTWLGDLLCLAGIHDWLYLPNGLRKCRRCHRVQYLAWMGEGWTDT